MPPSWFFFFFASTRSHVARQTDDVAGATWVRAEEIMSTKPVSWPPEAASHACPAVRLDGTGLSLPLGRAPGGRGQGTSGMAHLCTSPAGTGGESSREAAQKAQGQSQKVPGCSSPFLLVPLGRKQLFRRVTDTSQSTRPAVTGLLLSGGAEDGERGNGFLPPPFHAPGLQGMRELVRAGLPPQLNPVTGAASPLRQALLPASLTLGAPRFLSPASSSWCLSLSQHGLVVTV